MVWFASKLSPRTETQPKEFYLRRIVVYPLIEVLTRSSKRKYFLPVYNPKGKILGLTVYSNMDLTEEGVEEHGVVREGLFKVSAKLVSSPADPRIKYVHIFLVDLEKEPEDHIVGEFYLTYARTDFLGNTFTRKQPLILPHPNDLIMYTGVDMEVCSKIIKGKEQPHIVTYRYFAFRSEQGRAHPVIPETVITIESEADYARDPELFFGFVGGRSIPLIKK